MIELPETAVISQQINKTIKRKNVTAAHSPGFMATQKNIIIFLSANKSVVQPLMEVTSPQSLIQLSGGGQAQLSIESVGVFNKTISLW